MLNLETKTREELIAMIYSYKSHIDDLEDDLRNFRNENDLWDEEDEEAYEIDALRQLYNAV